MCRNNCNIIEAENKGKREKNSRLSYEERVEIETMLRSRRMVRITQIVDELGRDKSVISREIAILNGIKGQQNIRRYIQQEEHKEIMKIEEKKQEENQQ